ncbi:MFS transporter [Streptacidiphilus jiangxiensis]|uniref:Drug resistance transporter, EmrB/QacA subfamily n=1 Tax=Streptacidiphilus jiangxiensis TaxID=235985 RepID=A0A1H7P8U7_STRJI|nr:MFS transporter [Streptacidiphilus jiangxiensis]SEL32240.1 drug resistance transporter, EmrB/QacA subfamily [Streptacidiphilus jiangxiensis]
MPSSTTSRPALVLAVACLAAFTINLDTTIVNVALPSISRELHAGTRDLQWIVDGYNLSFATLVLIAGSLGDRFGRRPALLLGLAGFAAASTAAALVTGPEGLIALRFAMGACAAVIFPTTLSVITNAYPVRHERARAIGLWGAVTGLGVAVGPVCGGLLLSHFGWKSVFLALVPVSLIALLAAWRWVPESSNPAEARLDLPGLACSASAVGLLVYTIIEAPSHGWASPQTVVGFAASAALMAGFLLVERRRERPMIDIRLFRTPAFSAASASVTVAFFALFGFIFLVTQYFQLVRDYGALSTGVRILPVALTIAVGSVAGVALATRLGTRAVVVTGLLLLAAAYGWIALSPTFTAYPRIVGQMVLMGLGLGMTTAPATESILSVLPAAKAGLGSAVNDATRETGGTLGVAVLGSIFTSLYATHLTSSAFSALPLGQPASARESVAAALGIARTTHRSDLLTAVQGAFMHGFHTACVVAAVLCVAGALAATALPNHPLRTQGNPTGTPQPATAAR